MLQHENTAQVSELLPFYSVMPYQVITLLLVLRFDL